MIWHPLLNELDRWRDAGITARLWLRDDDAVEPSPPLDRLAAITQRFRVPLVIAVIPGRTGEALAHWLGDQPHIVPAIHGWLHANHAPQGAKKQELGLHRGRDIVLAELAEALRVMAGLHGERLIAMLVPPWNRIDPTLVPDLPALGYEALSAFGAHALDGSGLAVVNTHVDLIDFRGTRRCHEPALLARRIADELSRARAAERGAVGILSHHLVDDAALQFLADLCSVTVSHPACRWVAARDLI